MIYRLTNPYADESAHFANAKVRKKLDICKCLGINLCGILILQAIFAFF